MNIPKIYNPSAVEDKWYNHWMEQGMFHSEPDEREPFTIVIPPPNVTGVLHMGHVLNNTIQDVLVRRARMIGKNACWVPGTDHASIATEAKVVAMLKEKGISKNKLTREEFLTYAWDWKNKYGDIIVEQLKKLGCSCDWERLCFTMDDKRNASVLHVFVDLFNKGLIYRGVRMINWDPAGLTAVSDEEVIYKEVKSKLYYVRYKIEGSRDEGITVATTRPETILGDTGICVHPADKRYNHLKGKRAIVPMVNRSVPIIFDEYITMDFGTGALKVTPAHDINDYNLGIKYGLPAIDTISENGTMSKEAQFFIGEDRFTVRKKMAKWLDEAGQLIKVEDIKNKVGFSERTNAVIEPKISIQWFLKMDKISKPALKSVMDGTVKLIPEKYINTYRYWMENVHDWCISRQLWWGQRIPAWYCDGENKKEKCLEPIVSESVPASCLNCGSAKLRQDNDVLDTWFSSWLWPISVFDGILNPKNKDINYYYPTSDLITGPEILYFWVARMIIAGYEFRGKEPFKYVYLTGTVRDKQGRKMSKSLGNSPDPLHLFNKYGADGVRVGTLLSSPAGNDLTFDVALCEQGRNFANKIWNAFRLINSWEMTTSISEEADVFVKWFGFKLSEQARIIEGQFDSYRISDALMTTYKMFWDEFCSFYLEMIKCLCGKKVSEFVYMSTFSYFETLLKYLHPFMPFITEEIWQTLKIRDVKECIMLTILPDKRQFDKDLLEKIEYQKEYLRLVRNLRQQQNLTAKEILTLTEPSPLESGLSNGILMLSGVTYSERIIGNIGNMGFILKDTEYSFIKPEGAKSNNVEEKEKLRSELEYQKGFLRSVEHKLNNQRFVYHAKPEIVENEKNKKADAEAKINALEKQLKELK